MKNQNRKASGADVVLRWHRRKDARPAEILEAALDMFAGKGFAATRMDDIAKRAGVTAGTLYRYFPRKEDIFRALVSDSLGSVLKDGVAKFEHFGDPAPVLLKRVLMTWWTHPDAARICAIVKLMVTEGGNFPDITELHRQEVIEPGESLIARVIEYGIARGEFRQLNIPVTVKVVITPVLMGMLWKSSPAKACGIESKDLEHFIDSATDIVVVGLVNIQPEKSV